MIWLIMWLLLPSSFPHSASYIDKKTTFNEMVIYWRSVVCKAKFTNQFSCTLSYLLLLSSFFFCTGASGYFGRIVALNPSSTMRPIAIAAHFLALCFCIEASKTSDILRNPFTFLNFMQINTEVDKNNPDINLNTVSKCSLLEIKVETLFSLINSLLYRQRNDSIDYHLFEVNNWLRETVCSISIMTKRLCSLFCYMDYFKKKSVQWFISEIVLLYFIF